MIFTSVVSRFGWRAQCTLHEAGRLLCGLTQLAPGHTVCASHKKVIFLVQIAGVEYPDTKKVCSTTGKKWTTAEGKGT